MTETFSPTLDRMPYRSVTLSYDVPAPINTAENPGSYAVVLHDEEVTDLLHGMYGRPHLALKCVPMKSREMDVRLATWDGVELGMSSIVQNLIALFGLSPRVYGLVAVNETHAAQVTDYIAETEPNPRIDQLMALFKQLGVETRKNYDIVPHKGNWRDGLFVDYSGLYMEAESFGDLVAHVRQLATVKKGVQTDSAYEEVRELSIRGDRPASRQLPELVAGLSPRGHVIVLGCNLGHFSRLADHRPGTVRVVGVEKDPEVAQLARTINVLLGQWNIDVVTAKLPEDANLLPGLNYGLVICLSAIKYMGDVDAVTWLRSLAPALWLEGHGGVEADHYWDALRPSYGIVERLPDATDNMRRAQFLCRVQEGD